MARFLPNLLGNTCNNLLDREPPGGPRCWLWDYSEGDWRPGSGRRKLKRDMEIGGRWLTNPSPDASVYPARAPKTRWR